MIINDEAPVCEYFYFDFVNITKKPETKHL